MREHIMTYKWSEISIMVQVYLWLFVTFFCLCRRTLRGHLTKRERSRFLGCYCVENIMQKQEENDDQQSERKGERFDRNNL